MNSQLFSESTEPAILIVDDNPQNLQVLGKILQENKFEIEFATNGEAALKWCNDKKFDLILLDINMPGMDGFEVCKEIRLKPELNNVPVIFLTADNNRESILKGFEFGAQDYVTKPFDSRELLVRVRTHLKLKQSLENLEDINQLLEAKVLERTHQLKEANEKLESLNLQLVDLDRVKSDFLNLISHEIRTPLNGILGPVELLKKSDPGSNFYKLIEILDISVKRLEKFSLDALLITNLKTKRVTIKKVKIQLSGLIGEFLNIHQTELESKKIKVDFNQEAASVIIHGDPELIRKCFENIMDNAITYNPSGSQIIINIINEEQNTICEITDQGKGFEPALLENGFKLFTRGSEYHDNRVGNGLAVVKMIMEEHSGDVIIGNNPAGGASVKLLFRNNS